MNRLASNGEIGNPAGFPGRVDGVARAFGGVEGPGLLVPRQAARFCQGRAMFPASEAYELLYLEEVSRHVFVGSLCLEPFGRYHQRGQLR